MKSRAAILRCLALSLEEASLQLDVSNRDFIIFRNSDSGKINVLYKRPDGHHNLVEPEA